MPMQLVGRDATAVTATAARVGLTDSQVAMTLKNVGANPLYYRYAPGEQTSSLTGATNALIVTAGGIPLLSGESVLIPGATPYIDVACITGETSTLEIIPGAVIDPGGGLVVSQVSKTMTFDTSSTYNLFLVAGTVEVIRISGEVQTALNADVDNCKLEIWDGGATDLTTTADISSAPLDSFVGLIGAIASALSYTTSAAAALVAWITEAAGGFTMVAKRGTSTYIRLNSDGTATDGAIKWSIVWRALTDEGLVTAV